MSGISLQVLSGRTSLLLSALVGMVFFFSVNYPEPYNYVFSLLFFGGTLLITYVLFRYVLEKVIRDHLTTIYDTIHQLKRSPANPNKKVRADEAINEVQEEVLDWYLDNKKEIDRLTVLEEYRREFIGNVSHELKTPVFNIQGYLLTLLEGGLEDDAINRKYLERAEKSVEKLIKLLTELDMIIRLDTEGIQLNVQTIDIVDIVKEVTDSLDLKAEKRKIEFKIKRRNMEPLRVKADEDKLSQVLTNLFLNALKYGKENGRIEISFHDMKDKVLVEVKDDGIGMKKEELNRIFDRFYRTDAARGHDSKGFGLGLSIVKHIIEAHNETIHVNSIEGEGSTFSFTLKKAKSRRNE
ncbi:MAG: ATP-binding protein [Vicingaceae bacterium]